MSHTTRSISAIAVGTLIDTGVGTLTGLILSGAIALAAALSGANSPDLSQPGALESPPFLAAFAFIGALFTFLGSFVAARIAGREEVLHALVVGLLGAALPMALNPSPDTHPRAYTLAVFMLILVTSVCAGLVARHRHPEPPNPIAATPPPMSPAPGSRPR